MLLNSSSMLEVFCCSNIRMKNLHNVNSTDIIDATSFCFRHLNVTPVEQFDIIIEFAFSDINETDCKGRTLGLFGNPVEPATPPDLPFLFVWVLILLVTLLSNMCVIVCLRAVRALRDEGDNSFICSLAVSDLLSSLVIIPIKIRYVYHSMKFTDLNECIFFITADVTLFTISITNIFAISVVRFVALTYPYKYQSWMSSKSRCRWVIVGIWVYGVVWGLLCNLKWDDIAGRTIQMRDNQCQMDGNPYYVLAVYLFVFYIPVVIMALIYSRIFSITKYHASAINNSVVTDLLQRHCYSPTTWEDNNNSTLSMQHQQPQQQQQLQQHQQQQQLAQHQQQQEEHQQQQQQQEQHEQQQQEKQSEQPLSQVHEYQLQPQQQPQLQQQQQQQSQLQQQQQQQIKQKQSQMQKCSLHHMNDQRRPSRLSNMMKQSNAIFKASKMVGTVYGTFLICWFPVSVCSITTSFTNEVNSYDSNKWFYVFFIDTLPVLSSMMNPFIYVIMNKQYRRVAYKLLCSRRSKEF